MEGNSLFTYMTLALTGEDAALPRRAEALLLANETLRLYPTDRVMRPVMNSLRSDLETVASLTDEEIRRARQSLIQFAANKSNQSSKP